MEIIVKPTTQFYEYFNDNRFDDIVSNHIVLASEILKLAEEDLKFHMALRGFSDNEYGCDVSDMDIFLDENLDYTEKIKKATAYLEKINGTVYELKLS